MLTETDSRVSGFIYPSEVEVRLVLSPEAVVSHLHQTQRFKHQKFKGAGRLAVVEPR